MGDGLARLDTSAQAQSIFDGQGGVTVAHEDLRLVVLASTPAQLLPGVFGLVDAYRVSNVRERNS